jgi:DUF438 domain-containing protein
MSELINNNQKRKELLKELILQLHKGETAEAVKKQLIQLLGKVPYGVVVEVEQELIKDGLPVEEVLKLCDVHGQVLKGVVDQEGAQTAPPGHPVHTFKQENVALKNELKQIQDLLEKIDKSQRDKSENLWSSLKQHFNNLADVDKHYRRKENLLFPYLEKYEITGPPTVMWGKDDEIRDLLKGSIDALSETKEFDSETIKALTQWALQPTMVALDEMIYKEEEILLPMCLDTLTELEWYEIYLQSDEIGYCLYDPKTKWKPQDLKESKDKKTETDKIQLPTGNLKLEELSAIFNVLPVDITFVDKEDNVRFFSNNPERIFDRNRAILGRKVQMCHPPSSIDTVQKIVDDFRSGRESRAAFWINLQGKFIHIEYFAIRDERGEYFGTVEVSQDLTKLRELKGERRLLNYGSK